MSELVTCACGCGEKFYRRDQSIRNNKSGLFFKNRAHHDAWVRVNHPSKGREIQRGYHLSKKGGVSA